MSTDWNPVEIEAVVKAYLCMVGHQEAGEAYVKIRHNEWVQQRTGRSKGAVEFKFQNCSAARIGLGLAHVPGYQPARNFQRDLSVTFGRERRLPEVCVLQGGA